MRNSRFLRMFSLEFLSFSYSCRLLWYDCSVAGSYDPPSFSCPRNWHIEMLSTSAGISSIFLASPTSRKNLFQTGRSYSVFSTVFSGHCVKIYFCTLAIINRAFCWFSFCCDPIFSVTEFFYLIRVTKLALAVVWVHAEINICRKKWKVYTIHGIKLVNEI